MTFLHDAAARGDTTEIRHILSEPGRDVNTMLVHGRPPLFFAVNNSQLEAMQVLIELGADVNLTAKGTANAALHEAILSDRPAAAKLLIESGANVDAKTSNGFAPLHLAVMCKRIEIIKILLENRADVSAVDSDNKTALQKAKSGGFGYTEIIKLIEEVETQKDALGSHARKFSSRRKADCEVKSL